MAAFDGLARQGRSMLQVGVCLLLFTSFWGFAFPYMAAPPLGLSTHKLASLTAILLLGLGLAWPQLDLGARAAQVAFWLLLFSTFAIIAAYLLGTVWAAGNETMPLAAGAAHGSGFQEGAIRIVAYSSGPTGIVSFALILWGLRNRRGVVPFRASQGSPD